MSKIRKDESGAGALEFLYIQLFIIYAFLYNGWVPQNLVGRTSGANRMSTAVTNCAVNIEELSPVNYERTLRETESVYEDIHSLSDSETIMKKSRSRTPVPRRIRRSNVTRKSRF